MASEIPEMVYAFGPQPNAFMAVGILIKYFRPKMPADACFVQSVTHDKFSGLRTDFGVKTYIELYL